MAIAMRDMEKIDRKILVAASFPSWRQSAPRACPGRSCAPNTATKALIFDYVSHTMRMKAMQRDNAIGKDLGGIIAIALGDVPWMN